MSTATPEMIAAAWAAWHARHGGKLGPGPAFVEAINAAFAAPPAEQMVGREPVAEIVEATSPAAELIFGRDIKFFEALRTLPIGTKLYAAPCSVGGDSHQRILGILDDFAEMQPEEDEDWESWYHASFDLARQKIRAALSAPEAEG